MYNAAGQGLVKLDCHTLSIQHRDASVTDHFKDSLGLVRGFKANTSIRRPILDNENLMVLSDGKYTAIQLDGSPLAHVGSQLSLVCNRISVHMPAVRRQSSYEVLPGSVTALTSPTHVSHAASDAALAHMFAMTRLRLV